MDKDKEEQIKQEALVDAANEWHQRNAESIANVKDKLPPEVYEGFQRGWRDWIDHTKNVMNIGVDPTQQQGDDWRNYLNIFMEYPHFKEDE